MRPSSIGTYDVTITFALGFLSAVLLMSPFTDKHSLLPPLPSLMAIIISAVVACRSFQSNFGNNETLPSSNNNTTSSNIISPPPPQPSSSTTSSLSNLLASIHAPPLPTIPSSSSSLTPHHPLIHSFASSHTSLLSLIDTIISTLYIGTSLVLHLGPAGRGVSRVEGAALEHQRRRQGSSSHHRRDPGGLGKEKRGLFSVMRRQVMLLRGILGEMVEEEEWDVMEEEKMVVGLTVLMAYRRRLGELLSRSLSHLLRPTEDDNEFVVTMIKKCIDGAMDGSLYLTALCRQWDNGDLNETTKSAGGGGGIPCDDELRRFGEELDGACVSLGAFQRRRRRHEEGEEDEVSQWWTTLGDRLTEMTNLYNSIDEILHIKSPGIETEDVSDDGDSHRNNENMTTAVDRETLEFTCGRLNPLPQSSPDTNNNHNATTTMVFSGRGIIPPDNSNNQRSKNRKRQQETLSINNNEIDHLQRPLIDRSSLLRELQRRLDHLTVIETEKIIIEEEDVDDLSSQVLSTVSDDDTVPETIKTKETTSSVWLGASGSLLSELRQMLPEDCSVVVVADDD